MPEAVVTFPDGSTARVTGETEEAVRARVEQVRADFADRPSERQSYLTSLGLTGGDIALTIPKLVGELGVNASSGLNAGVETVARGVGNLATPGRPFDDGQGFRDRFAENVIAQKEGAVENPIQFPLGVMSNLPSGNVEGFLGGIQALPQLLSMPGGSTKLGDVSGNSFSQEQRRNADVLRSFTNPILEANPDATAGGDLTAKLGSLFSFRMPWARGINRLEKFLGPTGPQVTRFSPAINFALDRTLASPAMRKLYRGAGRSFEAGFEASVLDILEGDDPLETMALAAGGQAIGSGLIELNKGLVSGGIGRTGLNLGIAALATTALLQVGSSATPGGNNFILPNIEEGFQKVTLAMLLGAGAFVAGAGRLRGGDFAKFWPRFSDRMATLPRAASITMLESFMDSEPDTQDRFHSVMVKLGEDPNYFGENVAARLLRSFNNGSTLSEIETMMDTNEQFRDRVFLLQDIDQIRERQ